nr:hypothetical protein [uncultured Pseudomonas sp.]
MPKDLIITMLATIVAGVIAHQINQSTFIETITQKMGKVMRTMISLIARFGISLLVLLFAARQLFSFGVDPAPAERWEILAAIYFSIVGFEFIKFMLSDIQDVRSGRRPL